MYSGNRFGKYLAAALAVLTLVICFSACGSGNKVPATDMTSQSEVASQKADERSTSETKTVSTEKAPESTAAVTEPVSQSETTLQETTKQTDPETSVGAAAPPAESKPEETQGETSKDTEEEPAVKTLTLKIGGTTVSVDWEENESVAALAELVKDEPLTIQMSMYGGFEQVGSIGKGLPRNDVQTTTQAGDIVLYSGDQIVVFYGSNSWAYTRLGHVSDKSASQMKDLLGNGNVTIEISME